MSDVTQVPLAGLFWAERPRPECTDQLAAFAPLIGSWDLQVTNYREDGTSSTVDGEWHFGWALDGRAVADVWIVPSRRSRPPDGDGEWGVTIRFFDPGIDAWRSTWHGPAHGSVLPFTAAASATSWCWKLGSAMTSQHGGYSVRSPRTPFDGEPRRRQTPARAFSNRSSQRPAPDERR